MCNPRRVVVRVARQIMGRWQEAVEREREATGRVEATSRIVADIRLAEELGDMALEALDEVLAGGWGGWEQTEEGYRLEVSGVEMLYSPQSRELRIQAAAEDVVSARARVQLDLEYGDGQQHEINVQGTGRYYDDGWGGRTERRAREEAQREAEQEAERQEAALRERARKESLAAAEQTINEQAEAAARERLTEVQEARRQELQTQSDAALEAAMEEVEVAVNQLVGETYRRTLRRLAEIRGGRVIVDNQTGAMVNMMVEI